MNKDIIVLLLLLLLLLQVSLIFISKSISKKLLIKIMKEKSQIAIFCSCLL